METYAIAVRDRPDGGYVIELLLDRETVWWIIWHPNWPEEGLVNLLTYILDDEAEAEWLARVILDELS